MVDVDGSQPVTRAQITVNDKACRLWWNPAEHSAGRGGDMPETSIPDDSRTCCRIESEVFHGQGFQTALSNRHEQDLQYIKYPCECTLPVTGSRMKHREHVPK